MGNYIEGPMARWWRLFGKWEQRPNIPFVEEAGWWDSMEEYWEFNWDWYEYKEGWM